VAVAADPRSCGIGRTRSLVRCVQAGDEHGPPRDPIDTLSGIRSGSEEALAALLTQEWARLVRFLAGRLGSPEEAQDAAQEAFIRVWEHRERWTDGSARALLYRIATNVAGDALRKRRTRRAHDVEVEPRSSPTTPSEEMEGGEARRRVAAAVAALAPKRREVFELVRMYGLSYAEVADVLDLQPQTVANHMTLALRDLRGELHDLLESGRPNPRPEEPGRSEGGHA